MDADNDLVLTRDIAVPREKLFRCWTEPALMKQWFAPKPWIAYDPARPSHSPLAR